MSSPIRVLLVDDHTLFRRGMAALLGEDPGLQVVAEAGDAGQALRLAAQLQPDVILLDNHLPGVRGVDAIASLREAAPAARVLMLTVSDDAADLAAALRAGACGYLLKVCEADELTHGVHRAHRGEIVIGAEMAPKLAQAMNGAAPAGLVPSAPSAPSPAAAAAATPPPAAAGDALAALTPRERQIAAAIARGASNKQIARELDIAETTVKVHVQSLLRKLELSSRVQIAVVASSHGLG